VKILFTHPTGNANVRYAALGLHREGLLDEFWTCVNYRDNALGRLLPSGVVRQLKRRSFPTELQPHMRAHPGREMARLLAHRLKLGQLARHEHGILSVDAVYRSLDQRVARRLRSRKVDGVYAYEDGAATCFREARKRGLKTCYDLPIGYWKAARAILLEEAEREPAWACTLIGNEDSEAKTARKDEELALADVILVASSYTLSTLAYAPPLRAPVHVIPYGAPVRAQPDTPNADLAPIGGPLRVIFVGSLGQRKGLSYLFKACQLAGKAVELTVIGTKPLEPCAALDAELKRIRWIPSCPHSEVLAEMAAHHVFVFPSLFEGFGLVLLEAMAVGLPVIATANTAGPDLIDDGKQGFIVPIRSAEAIAEKLLWLHDNREDARAMGRLAAARAATFTWDNYGRRLAEKVRQACQPTVAQG
jgi:glycosyltransferase involved in cell wall biosynthesis